MTEVERAYLRQLFDNLRVQADGVLRDCGEPDKVWLQADAILGLIGIARKLLHLDEPLTGDDHPTNEAPDTGPLIAQYLAELAKQYREERRNSGGDP